MQTTFLPLVNQLFKDSAASLLDKFLL